MHHKQNQRDHEEHPRDLRRDGCHPRGTDCRGNQSDDEEDERVIQHWRPSNSVWSKMAATGYGSGEARQTATAGVLAAAATSNRSRFITLVHAAMKSSTNFRFASSDA